MYINITCMWNKYSCMYKVCLNMDIYLYWITINTKYIQNLIVTKLPAILTWKMYNILEDLHGYLKSGNKCTCIDV